MKRRVSLAIAACLVLLLLALLGWRLQGALTETEEDQDRDEKPVPVEVAAIERGPIERRRTFSGTLESTAQFRVSPKVGGRVESLAVDLADEVGNGQVVATLDSEEYQQEVARAEAELAVAEANLTEARSAVEIADRAMQRQTTLRERGVTSEAAFDTMRSEQLAAEAAVAVAEAEVQRARSALQTAKIQLGYTRVRATWSKGDDRRLVAEQTVEVGDTVAANTPLMSIVELDPIQGILYVTERDYARLAPGQSVTLRTDAFADRTFTGEVARVSPVFQSTSRQARVELTIPNPDRLLKPGMFIRVEAVLETVENAVIVPSVAIVTRADRPVVFVIDEQTGTAKLTPVQTGIVEGERTQVSGEGLSGNVVTLGQQLLDDGSAVTQPDPSTTDTTPSGEAEK